MSTYIIDCDQKKVEKRHALEVARLLKDGFTVYIHHVAPSFNVIHYIGLDGGFYRAQLVGRTLSRWEVKQELPVQVQENCRSWLNGLGQLEHAEPKQLVLQIFELALSRHVLMLLPHGLEHIFNLVDDFLPVDGELDMTLALPEVQERVRCMDDAEWAALLSHPSHYIRQQAMLLCAQVKTRPK